jgi:trafficking protein particle complex subunit 1
MQLILITHPRTGDQRDSLKHIYNLYVEYVVKNPLYSPGAPIK